MSEPLDRPEYDVFLSHASADKAAVEAIAHRLTDVGLRPFLDRWHLVPGEPWQEALEEALDASATCAVCIGPNGLAPWENEEMRAAIEERVRNHSFRVIPVLLPGAGPVPDLPRFLRRMTWCDFGTGLDDPTAFHRLVAGIRGEAPGRGPEYPPVDRQPRARGGRRSVDRALFRLGAKPRTWKRQPLLAQTVAQVRTGSLPVVLHGLAGIGKTTLLCQVADELRAEFPYALAVRFDGPAAVEPGYLLEEANELLAGLDRVIEGPPRWPGPWQRTLEALVDEFAEEPVLVLLDALNLADPAWQVELLDVLGSLPGARVVAASRERPPRTVAARAIAVPSLSRAEALAFMTEQAQLLDLTIDPKVLLDRLPGGVVSHPQALATLLAHAQDLPLDFVLLDGVPEDARAPARLVEQAVAALDPSARSALALAEVLSGVDLAMAVTLMRLPVPHGFRDDIELLRSRSLVERTGAGIEVPALVTEALGDVDAMVRAAAGELVTYHLGRAVRQAAEAAGDELAGLVPLLPQIAVYLADIGRWELLRDLAGEEVLEPLNARGYWKEYAVLLRLAVPAAAALDDSAAQIRLGLRLARKLPQLGDMAGARAALVEVERFIDPDGETTELARFYSHRAFLSGLEGDNKASLQDLERSRDIYARLGVTRELVVVDKLIGNLHLRRNDHRAARTAYEAALLAAGSDSSTRHALEAETSLALCDLADGAFDVAEARLRRAIERMQAVHYDAGLPRALLNLALVMERNGRPEAALALAHQAAEDTVTDPDVARAAGMVAWRLEQIANRPEGRHELG
jgi:tetratricopeptide (TPR) repeat protein